MAEVSFGEWLKRRRKALGLTQEQLALQINSSTSALRKIESEERRPSPQMVEQLAEVFHVAPNERASFLQFARGSWQAASPESVEDSPWHSSSTSTHSNLPVSITSFIGRETEQKEIADLIANHRLVTLTGIGGIGKTRLALEIGRKWLADYADEVWLVELASLMDPGLVPQTVATILGITQQSNRDLTATLIAALRERTLLLILDNCEHLLNACAELVNTLLKNCPNLKVLATSREALGMAGEVIYPVPSLTVPDVQRIEPLDELKEYESIHLFSERARLASMGFSITMSNAPCIAQVCQRLDGIPLAIELAATWMRTLSCQEIAQQIEQSLDFLSASIRNVPERHRSVQAVFDHSWKLLSGEERGVLRRLSLFQRGFKMKAGEQIAGSSLSVLTALVDKSFLRRNAQGRYDMHELLRQYAYEKLLESGEAEQTQSRHLEFYLSLAEEAAPKLRGTERANWLNLLEEEHYNLQAALQWSLQQEDVNAEAGLRLAGHLWRFWFLRGYWSEGRKWLTTRVGLRAVAEQAETQSGAGRLAFFQRDYEWVTMFSQESLAAYREKGDKGSVAILLDSLGMAAEMEGDYEKAKTLFAEGLALRREMGDKARIVNSLLHLGSVLLLQGNYEQAKNLLEEGLAITHELEDQWNMTWSWLLLGYVALFQNHVERALALCTDSLAQFQRLGDKMGINYSLLGLAMGSASQGKPERAASLFGAAEVLSETTGFQLPPDQRSIYERFVSAVRAQLDPKTFTTIWSAGRTMTLDEAVAYALDNN